MISGNGEQMVEDEAGTTAYATGRSRERGGCGDSSVLTAYGVYQGMRAAAEHVTDLDLRVRIDRLLHRLTDWTQDAE